MRYIMLVKVMGWLGLMGCLAGCSESAILAGNGLSMAVAVLLLWSTVNWNRSPDRKRAKHGME